MSEGPDREDAGSDELFSAIYEELRAIAGAWWRQQSPDHTLQPTAVVHDAYIKIASGPVNVQDENHFRSLAARAMRQVLVSHARKRAADKRGGADLRRVTLSGIGDSGELDASDLLDLDAAMDELGGLEPRYASIVEMRYFAGMSVEQVADVLGVSSRTVFADWRHARAWLARRLADGKNGSE